MDYSIPCNAYSIFTLITKITMKEYKEAIEAIKTEEEFVEFLEEHPDDTVTIVTDTVTLEQMKALYESKLLLWSYWKYMLLYEAMK